jgi:tripeptidyl-peptidase-1
MLLPVSHIVVLAIAAIANAAPSANKHVLHEKRSMPPSDWVKGARIEGSAIVPMRIGLTQTNLENGADLLEEV